VKDAVTRWPSGSPAALRRSHQPEPLVKLLSKKEVATNSAK
jgi:hypothetical protein